MEMLSIPATIARSAQARPDAIALVLGAQRVRYAELDARAEATRARLDALGLAPGAPVAVHAAKTPGTIALILACLRAGRPTLVPSAELGEDAFADLVRRADCAAVLNADTPGRTAEHSAAVVATVDTTAGLRLATAGPGPAAEVSTDDTALMLTTSGSTGTPKVVPLTVGALARFAHWAAAEFGIGPGTPVLSYAPLNFDLSLLDVWTTLAACGTVVLVDQDRATDGKHLVDLVRTDGVELVQSVPMLFRLLADAVGGEPFPDVRHVLLTGDRTPAPLLAELPALFPKALLHNIYGCTETNDSFRYEATGTETDLPIGYPLPGVDTLVLDADGAVVTGEGSGELLVRTPFQTTGYLGSDGAEFARIDGRTYFRSGDLVRRAADGLHTLLGRTDFRVKVRGTRVNLEEVEQVLLDHPGIREAAVVGLPDDLAGVRLHAVVRGAEIGAPNSLALREHLRLRLPRAAIPSSIQLVDTALPTTSTGKVDRRAIGARLSNRSRP